MHYGTVPTLYSSSSASEYARTCSLFSFIHSSSHPCSNRRCNSAVCSFRNAIRSFNHVTSCCACRWAAVSAVSCACASATCVSKACACWMGRTESWDEDALRHGRDHGMSTRTRTRTKIYTHRHGRNHGRTSTTTQGAKQMHDVPSERIMSFHTTSTGTRRATGRVHTGQQHTPYVHDSSIA